MLTATRKQLSVVNGLAKFAQVTVGRAERHDIHASAPEPKILLSGHAVASFAAAHYGVIEAARRGIREAEGSLGWLEPSHYVVKIEGLEVDGIDPDAACQAAQEATRILIQE